MQATASKTASAAHFKGAGRVNAAGPFVGLSCSTNGGAAPPFSAAVLRPRIAADRPSPAATSNDWHPTPFPSRLPSLATRSLWRALFPATYTLCPFQLPLREWPSPPTLVSRCRLVSGRGGRGGGRGPPFIALASKSSAFSNALSRTSPRSPA